MLAFLIYLTYSLAVQFYIDKCIQRGCYISCSLFHKFLTCLLMSQWVSMAYYYLTKFFYTILELILIILATFVWSTHLKNTKSYFALTIMYLWPIYTVNRQQYSLYLSSYKTETDRFINCSLVPNIITLYNEARPFELRSKDWNIRIT